LIELFANEGGHAIGVVLKAGRGAIGTGAGVIETGLRFRVLAGKQGYRCTRLTRNSKHTESQSF
jgi:hypothetical protein